MTKADRRIAQHIANLDHPDINRASRAEGYLIRYYGSKALAPLIEACSNAVPQVRYRAVWALGHTHDPRAYEAILHLTQDPDEGVRYDAVLALGILGDTRAIEPLIALMQQLDDEGYTDSAACGALSDLGRPAIPALVDVLKHGPGQSRMYALNALGKIGDVAAIEPLTEWLEDRQNDLREFAVEAIGELGGERALALIEKYLDDSNPEVRKTALYWVRELWNSSAD